MDSPEVDRLPLSHCYVVHHLVVGLRIPLAADGQPCRHKKQHPQREKECAFGKGGKVSPQRHGVESRAQEDGGEKKMKKKEKGVYVYIPTTAKAESQRGGPAGDYSATPSIPRAPQLPDLIQIFSPGVAGADETLDPGRLRRTRAACSLWKRAQDNSNPLSLPLRRRRPRLYFLFKLRYWLKNTSMKS